MYPFNDLHTLRQRAYHNDEMLCLRHYIHEQYSVPRVDFPEWALQRLAWRGDEVVLDVGCGPGRYAAALAQIAPGAVYYGADFSAGMLANHPQRAHTAQADAQHLPYPDGAFDVVMANHMLYHVPDIPQALQECRRVLKPDGVFLATTNSLDSMPQFRELIRRAILVLTAPGRAVQLPLPSSHLFSLESGTRLLARYFYAVVRYDLPGALVFEDVEPVMAYLESTRSLREPQLPEGVTWDAVMLIVREQVRNQLNYFGQLIVNKLSGVLVASDRGGFIGEFVRQGEREHAHQDKGDPTHVRRDGQLR
ncbi:MAG: class I SAM-dependent methyltransferase [Aggregatilineales bacterium]